MKTEMNVMGDVYVIDDTMEESPAHKYACVCLTQELRKNGKGVCVGVCVVERCGMTAVAIPRLGLIYTFKH